MKTWESCLPPEGVLENPEGPQITASVVILWVLEGRQGIGSLRFAFRGGSDRPMAPALCLSLMEWGVVTEILETTHQRVLASGWNLTLCSVRTCGLLPARHSNLVLCLMGAAVSGLALGHPQWSPAEPGPVWRVCPAERDLTAGRQPQPRTPASPS